MDECLASSASITQMVLLRLILLTCLLPVALLQSIIPASGDLTSPREFDVNNLKIFDNQSTVNKNVGLNSMTTFQISITNKQSKPFNYTAVFEFLDSQNFVTEIATTKGYISSFSSQNIRQSWAPSSIGIHTMKIFIISNLVEPSILSDLFNTTFSVVPAWQVEKVTFDSISNSTASEEPVPLVNSTDHSSDQPKPALDELKAFALDRINHDRSKFNLSPVKLSANEAAQEHAQDVLQTRLLSHWMTNGEKPYMTYTRLGGTGAVSQNVAISGYQENADNCKNDRYFCSKIDPFLSINETEHSMMYDDKQCCDNGHRDNILDQYHTHVSIGIAYDDYNFVMVQNFENNYITKEHESDRIPVFSFTHNTLTITGKIIDGQISSMPNHRIPITIYYDPAPTNIQYEKHKYDNSYDEGSFVACVLQESASIYCSGFACIDSGDNSEVTCRQVLTIPADNWYYNSMPNYDTFTIRADLSPILVKEGVYTVVISEEPRGADEQAPSWEAASFSIFYSKS